MPRAKGKLTQATRKTILAMQRSGTLDPVDSLAAANVLHTARLLDDLPPGTPLTPLASLMRAHLAASKALLGDVDGPVDDDLAKIIDALSTPPSWPTEQEGDRWGPYDDRPRINPNGGSP
jgi:hypothetical protein